MENKFGKISKLSLRTQCREGKTIIDDLFFTAPYKVMQPFPKAGGGISIMPLCASAGIMEGDRQEFTFHVGEGSDLEILSQSFDKIHKMKEGCALRSVRADIEKNSVFYYYPQPVIPYRDSAFESSMEFCLQDETSHLFLLEVISCGRTAHKEKFAYRKFISKVAVYRKGRLVYRDNTRCEPNRMPMEEIGMYEGYTHMANIYLSRTGKADMTPLQEKIWEILESEPECDGGATKLAHGDLAVRIFGHRAQKLQEIAEEIKGCYSSLSGRM
ncbi:MAG: urease accessory protein UreD [Lachnospiraceae bacterium]